MTLMGISEVGTTFVQATTSESTGQQQLGGARVFSPLTDCPINCGTQRRRVNVLRDISPRLDFDLVASPFAS